MVDRHRPHGGQPPWRNHARGCRLERSSQGGGRCCDLVHRMERAPTSALENGSCAATRAGSGRDDLEELVLSYRPLARALARRYVTAAGGREDLEQAAYEGLIKAIHRFEPERGAAFASFAVPTILGELRRYLRDTAWPAHVPRSLQERVREVRAAGRGLQRCARPPSDRHASSPASLACDDEAVVEALGVSSALSVVPLDAPSRDHDAPASVAEQVGVDDPGFERVECLAAIEEGAADAHARAEGRSPAALRRGPDAAPDRRAARRLALRGRPRPRRRRRAAPRGDRGAASAA